ncbi:phosphoribosylglycinamide formyltransferase [Naasia lichenicola]|uniref:Phosphoribosylglycinamide formyltransferase n=1 Tax=Naasia lichenicola TaxID=2565933 RepID=A0A4S4FI93_9MICO|nr:phosphoribosylglycinamide formyltransferase [Naasia lichenicola]
MLNLVVLISGGGSNLRALLEATRHGDFPARVIAVGADRDADGLVHAEEFGVPSFSVPFTSFADRESWGVELLAQLDQWKPDLVVLSGLMRLLPESVVAAYAPRLINTHPAYLPEFPGAHAVRDAIAAGVSQTGASVIVVDDGVDSGPILARERVPILPGDDADIVHDRIKIVERRLLAEVVRGIADGTVSLTGSTQPVSDPGPSDEAEDDLAHWPAGLIPGPDSDISLVSSPDLRPDFRSESSQVRPADSGPTAITTPTSTPTSNPKETGPA